MGRSRKDPLRVFIGYDRREQEAADVCAWSIRKHASMPLSIHLLEAPVLRRMGLYWRSPIPGTWIDDQDGRPFSTEFAFTRFLVPMLCGFQGDALFLDCDFLFTKDIAVLMDHIDPRLPVSVVRHNHQPPKGIKMDGRVQEPYPHKNWSSLVYWNCAHEAHKNLTVGDVNTKSGRWLHGFQWIQDIWQVGSLPEEWNWLEGHSAVPLNGVPAAIHYTRGGPWLENCQDVTFADIWRAYRASMFKENAT